MNIRNWDEDLEIKRMLAQCEARGYPKPEVYRSEWRYRKASCPVCSQKCQIRGYNMHYARVHDEHSNYPNQKGVKRRPYVNAKKVQDCCEENEYTEQIDPKVWAARAKAAELAILSRHS